MRPGARVVAAAFVAAASLTCTDQSITGTRRAVLTHLAIAPVFQQASAEGPQVVVTRMRGVLKSANGLDSSVAEAPVAGDSAVLEFANVIVRGDSSVFALLVKAFDRDNLLLFEGSQNVTVKPGDNDAAAPALEYAAADAAVATISLTPRPIALDWAGAKPGDVSCLNRVPSQTAHTEQIVAVAGKDAANVAVPNVRVGWTSRDTTVATVDSTGLIRARCSNKSTFVVARTYLGIADSVLVNVTAAPFALLMKPDSVLLPRQDDVQLNAKVVDENGNFISATNVNWASSDTSRATVSSTGLVHGLDNGRVIITARSGSRETVGIVQVVRPRAIRIELSPASDSVAVGQRITFAATAYDKFNARIPDPTGIIWRSTNTGIAIVSPSGTVGGVAAGVAGVIAVIDGVADTAEVRVIQATTGGVTARVFDAANGASLAGVTVRSATNSTNAVTTDTAGRFTLSNLAPGEDIVFTRTSYADVVHYNLRVQVGDVVTVADVPMAISGGSGAVTGVVVNALNDSTIAGATVKLFPGINPRSAFPETGVTTPAAVAETTTGAGGTFSFTGIASGTYTIASGTTGFTIGRVVVGIVSGGTKSARIPLSPSFSGSGLRVVLTWGDCSADVSVPCDLDAHLTGPATSPDTGRFHVAYYAREYVANGATVADLDNDAQTGLGPETITLRPVTSGAYKYYVHDYTDGFDTTSTRLANSSRARVDVYSGGSLVATFYPPRDAIGTVWAVFETDGTNMVGVNRMVRIQDFDTVPSDFIRADGDTSGSTTDPRAALVRDLRRAPPKR